MSHLSLLISIVLPTRNRAPRLKRVLDALVHDEYPHKEIIVCDGASTDGKTKVKSPSGTLSTAEAISVVNSGLALAAHFGDGRLRAADLAAGVIGAVVKDPVQDRVVWQEYLETVVKERDEWKDLYRACRDEL